MDIRRATKEDWPAFAEMWIEYLAENLQNGGDMIPTELTMETFEKLFMAYESGELHGVALIQDGAGVILWGAASAVAAFTTRNDPFAIGWGTYVREEHRGKKISTALREAAKQLLLEMGFKNVVGGVTVNNEHGLATVVASGFVPTHTQWVFHLEEGE